MGNVGIMGEMGIIGGVATADPGVELRFLCEGVWSGDSHSGHGKATMRTKEL